jgi:hypothetical protein
VGIVGRGSGRGVGNGLLCSSVMGRLEMAMERGGRREGFTEQGMGMGHS